MLGRKEFITTMGLGVASAISPTNLLSLPLPFKGNPNADKLKFGVVADVHKDLMPDADQRIEMFIQKAVDAEVDFIIQLGDFCMADSINKGFLRRWNQFKRPKYHVLGNHDMDKNSKQEMLDFWQMEKTYYSFDQGGFHFIVLDANFIYQDGVFTDYKNANFYVKDSLRTYINPEQIDWFASDLMETSLPTIVFSHQSLWHYQWGVKNRLTLQKIMESHSDKIICCMNGHNHLDYHHHQNGIDYFEINSMSYQWMSDRYKTKQRFAPELYESYQHLEHLAAYQEPLYAFVELNPEGTLYLEGVKSTWMPPSPYDMGLPPGVEGMKFTPEVSSYSLPF